VPNSLIILNLFPERWEYFKNFFDGSVIGRVSQCQIVLNLPQEEQLKKILVLKAQDEEIDVDQLFAPEDLKDILHQESIREVLNRASHYYRFRTQDIPLPVIIRPIRSFEDEVKEQLESIREQLKVSSFEEEVRETLKAIMIEIASLRDMMETAIVQSATKVNSVVSIPTMPLAKTMSTVETTLPVSSLIVDYIEREKALLENAYEDLIIISDSDDVGKLLTVTEAFNTLSNKMETDRLKLGKKKIPENLLIKTPKQSFVVGFLQVSDMVFPSRIKNFNELVSIHEDIQFTLLRDEREVPITGKVGKAEIDKLNKADNGQFFYMDKEDRLTFEVIYKLIIDIQNKDFEIDLQQALKMLESIMSHYWVIKMFKKAAAS
jgi:hypothetical protein